MLRGTGLCERNPPVAGGFPSQRASYAENVSIWWRQCHVSCLHITVPFFSLAPHYRSPVGLQAGVWSVCTLSISVDGNSLQQIAFTLINELIPTKRYNVSSIIHNLTFVFIDRIPFYLMTNEILKNHLTQVFDNWSQMGVQRFPFMGGTWEHASVHWQQGE